MRLFRGVCIGLGIVGLLAVIGLVAGAISLHVFLHSDGFRHELETRASQALGGTVDIKQIDWNAWDGVKVNGMATKLVSSHGTLVMQVESESCTYSLSALLHRQLLLENVTILQPQIIVSQSLVPKLPNPTAAPGEWLAATQTKPPFDLTVAAVNIDNGDLSIQDAAGASKAELQGISVKANTAGYFKGDDVTGTLTVDTVALPKNLKLTNFSAPFTYRDGALTATPFHGSCFAGQITGDYKLDPGVPSLLQVAINHLDLAQLGQAATPDSPTKLSGSLALQSVWTNVETSTFFGQGDLQISNGKLEGVKLLHDLAGAFQLQDMSDPDLKSVSTHFQVAAGTTHFDHLQIISTVFEMSGSGVIDPAGNLNANMTLTLHPDAFKQIPSYATAFFTKLPDGGGSIPYQLTGTVADPRSDLTTRTFIQTSKVQKLIKKTFDQIFH
jgi:uncharacterized protein involved in outer membrane biogenesis